MKTWIAINSLEYIFNELESLLSNGENPQATEIFRALTTEQQKEYIQYRFDCFNESYMVNEETGEPLTLEEVEEDLLYLINHF